tara:strand:+ start:102 stop:944 length:843 start_codon:yes stop_codon:yes gene_type:complete
MTTGMTFNNKLSLFIPRVVPEWASQEMITTKFNALDIGTIERVDFLEKVGSNGVKYYQAFLHFEMWEDNAVTRNIQEKIVNPEQTAKLVYDEPWYWILLKNNNPLTQEEVAANAALQERVVALEQQVTELNNHMVYWNNLTYTYLNWHNSQLAPLWSHAVNTGMNEGVPTWMMNNNEEAPTMTQMAEQSAMVDNDADANSSMPSSMPSLLSVSDDEERSVTPSLVSDNEISDDDMVIQTPSPGITAGTPVTPEHNYVATNHFPFDDSVIVDLTDRFDEDD